MDDSSRWIRCGFRICFLVSFLLLAVPMPSFFFQPPSSYLSPSPDSNLSRISLQKQSFGLGLSAHCKRKLQHFVCLFWFEKKFFHVFCTFVTTLAPSNFFEEEKKLRKVTNNLDLEQKESQTNHKTMF